MSVRGVAHVAVIKHYKKKHLNIVGIIFYQFHLKYINADFSSHYLP